MAILKLHPVVVEDCSALVDIWFAAFSDPASRVLFPDTPGVREWLESAISYDLRQRPFQRYLKIVDSEKTTNNGHRLAAYAKWDLSTAEERGPRYPAWHADMPAEQCEAFVMRGESNRKRVMREQKHIFLDIVLTHPHYQRRGAASMLLKWGCELADSQGLPIFVSASQEGAPLYTKFGFVERGVGGTTLMVRQKE